MIDRSDKTELRPIEAKAFWRLGRLKAEVVEPLITAWQVQGLDGEAILELGWEPCTSLTEIEGVLVQAFREAGAGFDLSDREAAWIYIRRKLQGIAAQPEKAQAILYELTEFTDFGETSLFSEEDHEEIGAAPIMYDGGFGEELALRELLALRGNGYQVQLDMSGVDRGAEVERIAAALLARYYSLQGYLPADLQALPQKYEAAELAWMKAAQQ